jgi:hypothetical protein
MMGVLWGGNDEPPPARPRRRPTVEELQAWDKAATERREGRPAQPEDIFESMDALLRELYFMYPIRARRVQREIKWLRNQAAKHGLPWGQSRWRL